MPPNRLPTPKRYSLCKRRLNEKNQLQAEAEALATQVVNDFEELSLIRSLASSMELPSSGVGVNEVALNSLRPLAERRRSCLDRSRLFVGRRRGNGRTPVGRAKP